MATTFVDYTGDGNATKAFSFPSYKEADIKVEVDNVIKTSGNHYNITSYTTTGGGNVVFTSGNIPSSPASIRIYRDTDVDTAKATFTAGSSVKAGDLNNNVTQLLYSRQEEQNQTILTSKIKDAAITTAKIKDDNVTTAKIADDNVTMAKLGSGVLPTDITVASANLVDGTIVNADINASADIAGTKLADDSVTLAKLGSGALPTDITVASANLVNGTIVDADINSSAAITGTKVTPAFGTQNVSTSGTLASGAQTVTGNIAVSGTVDGRDVAADGTKLDGIESGATADQTNAEIRAAVEAASDSNVFTDADHSKLNAIEASATADQTNAEIKTAYEANADTNEFSDAEQSKLAGIETAATADQTASEIKTLLQSDKLELSEMNTTSLDSRYYTETEADAAFLRQDSTETIASGVTWSSVDSKVATTAAIDARIIDLVDDVGGFVPIASETAFPTANPDVNNGAGTLVSIKAIGTARTPSGGTVTIADGAGSGNTVTITGCGSTVLAAGFGAIVETTTTLHTYTFHRLTPKATEVTTVAANAVNISAAGANVTNIDTFANRYQVSNSAPTARSNSSSLANGDLWFDSSSNKVMMVYDGTSGDGYSPITPNQSDLTNINIVAGQITYSEDLGNITDAVNTGSGNNSVNTVGSNITNVNTVAGSIANVNSVAADATDIGAVAGKATEIGRLGTADAVADLAILGTTDVVSDLNTLATTAIVSDMDTLADISSNITTVAGVSANVTTVAGNNANVTTVAGSISNVNTVGGAIANVNRYADEYVIQSSTPSSPSEGDLWYNTTSNALNYYNSSSWVAIAPGIAGVINDANPQLANHLDCNDKNLTEVGTISGNNLQIDFGSIA